MKKLLSLSVLFAALCIAAGCGDSKTSSSGTPVKSGSGMSPSAPGGAVSGAATLTTK